MSTEKVETQVVKAAETAPKKTTKRTSAKTKKTIEPVAKKAEPIAPVVEKAAPIVPKDVDLNQFVVVKNGFHGKLVYISSRTGEKFIWDNFGSEQEMELRELRNARNSAKDFFINNWFMFDEPWIIDYLGLKNYYKNTLDIESFDDIFAKDVNELKAILGEMSRGQKKSIGYRAHELVANGKIDSLKVINTLEESLGIELIEH